MTYKQIEKAARDHADKYFIQDAEIICNEPWNNAKDLYAKTLADFGKYCISHQWVSIEEWLPEDDTMVTAHSPNGRIDVLKYHDGEFIDELGQAHRVDYFIPIPSLNPEKEER